MDEQLLQDVEHDHAPYWPEHDDVETCLGCDDYWPCAPAKLAAEVRRLQAAGEDALALIVEHVRARRELQQERDALAEMLADKAREANILREQRNKAEEELRQLRLKASQDELASIRPAARALILAAILAGTYGGPTVPLTWLARALADAIGWDSDEAEDEVTTIAKGVERYARLSRAADQLEAIPTRLRAEAMTNTGNRPLCPCDLDDDIDEYDLDEV